MSYYTSITTVQPTSFHDIQATPENLVSTRLIITVSREAVMAESWSGTARPQSRSLTRLYIGGVDIVKMPSFGDRYPCVRFKMQLSGGFWGLKAT